ncbi:NPP1-like protein [Phytophthora cinnamomi]|uniref:NPP1-like protein n=1 Tax=Phytophthora cinnamomi TaxID=4785 RepID=UPI00355A0217|nr:NPP1-like protein [Phytophthora cinnamomi]
MVSLVLERWENAIVWLDCLSESATISGVSVSGVFGAYSTDTPPAPGLLDGSSIKLMYTNSYGMQHYLKTATSPGLFQDLVMWDDMTKAAHSALETTDFNNFITTTVSGFADSVSVDVSMADTNFFPKFEKTFPF